MTSSQFDIWFDAYEVSSYCIDGFELRYFFPIVLFTIWEFIEIYLKIHKDSILFQMIRTILLKLTKYFDRDFDNLSLIGLAVGFSIDSFGKTNTIEHWKNKMSLNIRIDVIIFASLYVITDTIVICRW